MTMLMDICEIYPMPKGYSRVIPELFNKMEIGLNVRQTI